MNQKLNKYGSDLDEIKNTLENSKAVKYILENVKERGHLEAFSLSVEKYNYELYDSKKNTVIRRDGPPWDVEGSPCEDIYVKIWMNPLERNFIPDYLTKIKNWLSDSYNESYHKNIFKRVKSFFSWAWALKSYLYPYHEFWAFVVDSFSTIKSIAAKEIITERLGGYENEFRIMSLNYPMYIELYNQILSELNHDYIENYLNKDHWRINAYMWVSKSDPTCFVVDERSKKFDMKSGWSDKEILMHIERWFYFVTGKRITIKNVKENYDG